MFYCLYCLYFILKRMGDSWLLDKEKFLHVIRCPVCLTIPRDVPIPQCDAGHIVCRPCSYKANMTKCPTCRKDLNRNITSSLAASLIQLVPHQCKFAKFGCKVQDLLSSLVNHEKFCEVRKNHQMSESPLQCIVHIFCWKIMINMSRKWFPVLNPKGVFKVLYKTVIELLRSIWRNLN